MPNKARQRVDGDAKHRREGVDVSEGRCLMVPLFQLQRLTNIFGQGPLEVHDIIILDATLTRPLDGRRRRHLRLK